MIVILDLVLQPFNNIVDNGNGIILALPPQPKPKRLQLGLGQLVLRVKGKCGK